MLRLRTCSLLAKWISHWIPRCLIRRWDLSYTLHFLHRWSLLLMRWVVLVWRASAWWILAWVVSVHHEVVLVRLVHHWAIVMISLEFLAAFHIALLLHEVLNALGLIILILVKSNEWFTLIALILRFLAQLFRTQSHCWDRARIRNSLLNFLWKMLIL